MKTYEEMARNVLKRRDEELQKAEQNTFASNNEPPEKVYPASGKRHLFPKIAIPCASVVTAAAVGLTVWHNVSPGENKGEYVFSDFKGSGRYSEDYAVTIDETIDPKDRDYSDVYKGGETEINYNDIGAFCPYVWPYKNSVEPTYKHSDFVSISDINYFYGIKFDRLNEVLGEGEHDPFGYHTQDVESDDVVMHSARGYYNVNTIHYVADDGLGGFAVTVSASFEKLTNAGELYSGLAPEAAKNPKPSVINGFDALVYQWNGGELVAEIEMNGVYVTISAAPIDGVYRDPDAFVQFKKIYESYLLSYTAPIDSSDNLVKKTDIKVLDGVPEYLLKHHVFFNGHCILEPVKTIQYTIEELNELYGIEFNRLGRLHSDWIASNYNSFGVYVPEGEEANENNILSRENEINYIIRGDIQSRWNLYSSEEITLSVSAVLEDEKEFLSPFDSSVYSAPDGIFSVINGKNALVYHSAAYEDGFGAIIEMGKTLVRINSRNLSEEEFINILKEYTADEADLKPRETNITLQDSKPSEFDKNDPFNQNAKDFSDCDFDIYLMWELENECYNIDFDCFTSLHKDWKEAYGSLRIYTDNIYNEESKTTRRENVWTRNAVYYTLPDTSTLTVEAQLGELPEIAGEYSLVNGYRAMVYLDGADSKTYPNGNAKQVAVIEMNGTLVRISAAGFTEELFMNALDEFTEAPFIADMFVKMKTKLNYVRTDSFVEKPDTPALDKQDFHKLTMEELNKFYDPSLNIEFDYLTQKHPAWKAEIGELGYYKRESEEWDYYTLNTITYTTENGGTVTVSAQKEPFASPIDFEYDGEQSYVNNWPVMVYADQNGNYIADLDSTYNIRIKTSGVSRDDFESILREFFGQPGKDQL